MKFKYYVNILGFKDGTRILKLLNNSQGIAVDCKGRETYLGNCRSYVKGEEIKRISPEDALILLNCSEETYYKKASETKVFVDPKPKKKDTKGMKIKFEEKQSPAALATFPRLMKGKDGRILLMLTDHTALVIKNKDYSFYSRSSTPEGTVIDIHKTTPLLGLGYNEDNKLFYDYHTEIKGNVSMEF